MHVEKVHPRELRINPSTTESLQAQIAKAQREGVTRILLDGVFKPQSDAQFSLLTLTKSLELIGVNGAVLDGQNKTTHLIYVEDAVALKVSGVKFVGGNTDTVSLQANQENHSNKKLNIFRYLDGGAITLGAGSKVTVENCTFSENKAAICGGAISNLGGHLIITNCTFAHNSCGDTGAAIDNLVAGSLTIVENSRFINNQANQLGEGTYGAITAFPDTYLVVLNSNFSQESATAIDYQRRGKSRSHLIIESCLFNPATPRSIIVNPLKNSGAIKEILQRYFQLLITHHQPVKLEGIPRISAEIQKKHRDIFDQKYRRKSINLD